MRERFKNGGRDFCASKDITDAFGCEYNWDQEYHVDEYKLADKEGGECTFFLGVLDQTITLTLKTNNKVVFQLHDQEVLTCNVAENKDSIYVETERYSLKITVLPSLRIDMFSIHHLEEESQG